MQDFPYAYLEGGAVSLLMLMEQIDGAHPLHTQYPLLPEDVLVLDPDGTYTKVAPGIGVSGFRLTPEQAAQLKPVDGRIAIVGNM